MMASISGKETKPEKAVRSVFFRDVFRFRKNVKTLSGKPYIVLPKYKTVIFIHGCFWQGHKNCSKTSLPTTNTEFWQAKINANIFRDKKVIKQLRQHDWGVITVLECEVKSKSKFDRTMPELLKKIKLT